jgi:hypothetical protein
LSERRLALRGLTIGEPVDGYRPLELDTSAGPRHARFYPLEHPTAGVVLMDGSPGEPWQARGMCAIVPLFQDPADGPGCVLEGLLCAHLLLQQGLERVLAVGPGADELARVLPGVELL